MAATNLNASTSSSLKNIHSYYDRKTLEMAKTNLIYQQFGQKKSIPANSGKTVYFRRYTPFAVGTTSLELTEGTTPTGQTLVQTEISATVKQYGAYVEVSDLLKLTAVDPVVRDSVMLLGEQLGNCLDWVTRDAMLAGASFQYAGGGANTYAVAKANVMSLTEIRKAHRTLTNSKARPFTDNGKHFVMVISPSQRYDLQADTDWKNIALYVDPKRAVNGEIGRVLGMMLVESTEVLVTEQSVHNTVDSTVTNAAFVLADTPSAEEIAYLSVGGNKIMVGASVAAAVERTLHATTPLTVAEGVYTVTTTSSQTFSAGDLVFSKDAGAPAATGVGADIHHALTFGMDAYGVIDIAGNSGSIRSIILSPQDALEQFSTVGAKVLAFCAKVLNSLWIIDVQTGVSD